MKLGMVDAFALLQWAREAYEAQTPGTLAELHVTPHGWELRAAGERWAEAPAPFLIEPGNVT